MCAFRLALPWAFLLAAAGAGPSALAGDDALERNYRAYVEARYGKSGSRPPREILEQRCIEDLQRHFIIVHLAARHLEYFEEVADLLGESASPQSEEMIRAFVERCWQLEQDRRLRQLHGNPLEHYGRLRARLSETLLAVTAAKHGDKGVAELVIDALRESPKVPLHSSTLLRNLGRIGPEGKPLLYGLILDPKWRESREADWRAMFLAALKDPAVAPTDDELERFTASKQLEIRVISRTHAFQSERWHKTARELILKEMQADDPRAAEDGMIGLVRLLEGPEMSGERKAELFDMLDRHLLDLEKMVDEGKSYKRLSPSDLTWCVDQGLGLLMDDNNNRFFLDLLRERLSRVERHVNWFVAKAGDAPGEELRSRVAFFKSALEEMKRK